MRLLLLLLLFVVLVRAENDLPLTVVMGPSAPADGNKEGNIASLLWHSTKDFYLQIYRGARLCFAEHQRCQEIRSKQNTNRKALRISLQKTMTADDEIRKKVRRDHGGISYDEFCFLRKGKENRSKAFLLLFSMAIRQNLAYYLCWWMPDTFVPSPFRKTDPKTRRIYLERERYFGLLQMAMKMEEKAYGPSKALFGGTNRKGFETHQKAKTFFSRSLPSVLDSLEDSVFLDVALDKKNRDLCFLPEEVLTALSRGISGHKWYSGILPGFMKRGEVLSHLQKVKEDDDFLIEQQVRVEDLNDGLLVEACSNRMIGTINRSPQELRNDLHTWLDRVVVQPKTRRNVVYHENLARASMMGYFALQAARNQKTNPFSLPRTMLQPQQLLEQE